MATSAAKLAQIIDAVHSMDSELTKEQVYQKLNELQLLPKKMTAVKTLKPKPVTDKTSIFATKISKQFAENHNIIISGTGSGKDGKFTMADLKKFLKEQSTKDLKPKISPAALKISQDKNIDISDIKGSGLNGLILVKDLKNIKGQHTLVFANGK